MKQVKQVIYNMIVTNKIDNKILDYIDPWGETLAYIAWVIRYFYHHTLNAAPSQAVFGRYMIFNLTLILYCPVTTVRKKHQVDINNSFKNVT